MECKDYWPIKTDIEPLSSLGIGSIRTAVFNKIFCTCVLWLFFQTENQFESDVERMEREDEEKRLDRQWYSMDDGVDNTNDPFGGMSDEYMRRKEQELEQKKKKKMSAQQRQIHKVIIFTTFI